MATVFCRGRRIFSVLREPEEHERRRMDQRILKRDSEMAYEVCASIFQQCCAGRLRMAEVPRHSYQKHTMMRKALMAPTDCLGQETRVGGEDGEKWIL